ncbi:hypothetical protein ACWC9T_23930 [Kitasatospora sp. NPDC001159]
MAAGQRHRERDALAVDEDVGLVREVELEPLGESQVEMWCDLRRDERGGVRGGDDQVGLGQGVVE